MMGLATLITASGGLTRSTAGRWTLVGGMLPLFRVRPRGMIPHLSDPATRRGKLATNKAINAQWSAKFIANSSPLARMVALVDTAGA